ncbi:MAG TPA: glycosyltransferase, partial [Pirellulales bacterium]|nr:glycosyltransferase [Pirellulales bacterium]
MEGWQTQLAATPESEQARQLQVTVLLPAYNEKRAIQRVLGEIVEALADEPIGYEIVVVDDASTDGTAELAEQFAA